MRSYYVVTSFGAWRLRLALQLRHAGAAHSSWLTRVIGSHHDENTDMIVLNRFDVALIKDGEANTIKPH